VALKAFQAIRTTSPLVQQCQKALNISIQHAVRLYGVPKHAEVWGNEIANKLIRGSSALKFVGPEPALGASRQDIRRIRHWLFNQHWVRWWGILLLHHQGPWHMPQMHRSLQAYCATFVPPWFLDVPTSAARCLHVHMTWEILAAKGGTVGENVGQ